MVATIVISVLLAALLVLSAAIKFTHREPYYSGYLRVGVPARLIPYLALLLIAAAAALLLGLLWPPLGIAAAAGLTGYFIIATAAHLRVRDLRNLPTPLVYLALAVATLALQLITAG
jgi:hypothetical protein